MLSTSHYDVMVKNLPSLFLTPFLTVGALQQKVLTEISADFYSNTALCCRMHQIYHQAKL